MKSVLTTAAVLVFIATPVLAQSFDPGVGTGNITPSPVASQNGTSAYGQTLDAYDTGYTRAQASGEIHYPAHRSRCTVKSPLLWRLCLLTGLLQQLRL
jgi:hypothetical protein